MSKGTWSQSAQGIIAYVWISQFLLCFPIFFPFLHFVPTHLSLVSSFLVKLTKQAEVGRGSQRSCSWLWAHSLHFPALSCIGLLMLARGSWKVPEWGVGLVTSISVWFTALRKTESSAPAQGSVQVAGRLQECVGTFIYSSLVGCYWQFSSWDQLSSQRLRLPSVEIYTVPYVCPDGWSESSVFQVGISSQFWVSVRQ